MGSCLAQEALSRGWETVIVSGPVSVSYPDGATIIPVTTTEEMLEACLAEMSVVAGVIGAAAPCDYRPVDVLDHKLRKTGEALQIKLVETPDVMATLGRRKKPSQWTIGFALETEDARFRALTKLEKKSCDLVVLNGVSAINSSDNEIEIIGPEGQAVAQAAGSKRQMAKVIFDVIEARWPAGSPTP